VICIQKALTKEVGPVKLTHTSRANRTTSLTDARRPEFIDQVEGVNLDVF